MSARASRFALFVRLGSHIAYWANELQIQGPAHSEAKRIDPGDGSHRCDNQPSSSDGITEVPLQDSTFRSQRCLGRHLNPVFYMKIQL